jgi:hypothetical protein
VRAASSTKAAPGRSSTLPCGEFADADLGALQVGHDGHLAPGALRRLAHQARAVDVVVRPCHG